MLLLHDWIVQRQGRIVTELDGTADRVVLLCYRTGGTANMVLLLCYRTGWYGRQGCVTGSGNATDRFKARVTGLGNAAYKLCYRTR